MNIDSKKILLIASEEIPLKLLAEYSGTGVEPSDVLTVGNAAEAIEILTQKDFDLVIFGKEMLDSIDSDLLGELQQRWPHIDILSINDSEPVETHDPGNQPEQEIGREITKPNKGFKGVLKIFQLADIIQMYCLSGASLTIHVRQYPQEGFIFIKNGKIVHAVCNETKGEEAFYQILSWKSGSFEVAEPPSTLEMTIARNWEFLLLEGARMSDELALANDQTTLKAPEDSPSLRDEIVQVLIVDDSPLMCSILQDLLSGDERIRVVGVTHNGEEALRMIEERKPNLITLDVNMPVMSGGTTIKHIMVKSPCPVVIISKLENAPLANIMDFLQLGAVDFIPKPKKSKDMPRLQKQMITRLQEASRVKIKKYKRIKAPQIRSGIRKSDPGKKQCENLILVNSGGGGHAELIKILSLLRKAPETCCVALQGMDSELLVPFSQYLDLVSNFQVLPIADDAPLLGERCYLSALDSHFGIISQEGRHSFRLEEALSGGQQTPNAFDHLLLSISENFSGRVFVVLLSGADVGNLGGLRSIRERKGGILAQPLDVCLTPHRLEKVFQAQLVDFVGNINEIVDQIFQAILNSPSEGFHSTGEIQPDDKMPPGARPFMELP